MLLMSFYVDEMSSQSWKSPVVFGIAKAAFFTSPLASKLVVPAEKSTRMAK